MPSLDFRSLCRHKGGRKEVVRKSHGLRMDRGGVDEDIEDSHGTMGHVIAIKNK